MIAVTGATGHLGHLTLKALLQHGVPAQQLVALVRDPARAADLAAQGVSVRQADYHQPQSLRSALQGVDRLLLVSSSDFNDRVGQHQNVVDAAREAGVTQLAYTSILAADTTPLLLATDHRATEALIRASGLPFTFLRNGWYWENYDGSIQQGLAQGGMLGAAGEGRVTPAARADYAQAAAAVLNGEGHAGRVYELGGDQAITLAELAAEVERQSGRPFRYTNLPQQEYAQTLRGFGLPEVMATILADGDAGIERGLLATDSGDLRRLIGHPSTPLAQAVQAALAGQGTASQTA